jgi:hypothetical protein
LLRLTLRSVSPTVSAAESRTCPDIIPRKPAEFASHRATLIQITGSPRFPRFPRFPGSPGPPGFKISPSPCRSAREARVRFRVRKIVGSDRRPSTGIHGRVTDCCHRDRFRSASRVIAAASIFNKKNGTVFHHLATSYSPRLAGGLFCLRTQTARQAGMTSRRPSARTGPPPGKPGAICLTGPRPGRSLLAL